MMDVFTPRRALTVVLVVTAALYLSLWSASWLVWDDDTNIFLNPFFAAGRWRVFWTSEYYGLWVPVTSSVWQTLFTLGRGATWPFRLLNAGLHVANVVLVWWLIERWARAVGAKTGWGAVAGAAVFALHPLQVQTVAWLSGGRDLLATFFALIALDLYFREGRRARALATLSFAAACLSKPSVVVLPVVALALAPTLAPTEPLRRHSRWLGLWLVGSAAVVWWTLGAQASHLGAVDLWRRPWLVGDALWFYETRLFDVFHLAPNYARTPNVVFDEPWSWVTALAAYAVVLGAWWVARSRGLVVAWAAFLLPISGLVSFGYQRISGVADHYAYPAMIAVAAGVAGARPRWGRLGRIAFAVVLVIYTGVVYRRLAVWRSNSAFFNEMARAAPRAYATGIGMSVVACDIDHDYRAGVRWTEVALTERPLDVRALANQAFCLFHAGDFDATIGLESRLNLIDRAQAARVEPTGYASLIASIGAAKIERRDWRAGYRLLCEARGLFPDSPIYRANVTAADEILQKQGVAPACE